MLLPRPKTIGLGAAILFAALWALPLARAFSLFRESRAYFAETGSINASNDVALSTALLCSYVISLLAALALAWLFSRRLHLLGLLPVVALVFAVVEVLSRRPESPVILVPAIMPWRPALISVAAVALAALFIHTARFTNGRHGQPEGPANGSQRIRPETSRRSLAAGSRR
ncbi:MAG: hypothetical protein J0L84_14020 [Verrucomicrobia bacterium]|nr:hypothetical protein [Verrucomicrobiota bacterium]